MGNVHSLKDYINSPSALNGVGNLVFAVLICLLCLFLCCWMVWALSGAIERSVRRFLPRAQFTRYGVIGMLALLLVLRWRTTAGWFIGVFQFDVSFQRQALRSEQWALFLVFGIVLLIMTWMLRNYLTSVPGRNVVAIREDEIAATNLGVNCTWLKLQNFMLASALAGLGGAMLAHTISLFKPLDFNFFKSVDVLLMVVLGGMGSLTGSYVGAISITLLPEVLRFLGRWRMVIYSLALIVLMLFRPGGLLGTAEIGELIRLRLGRLAGGGQAGGTPAGGTGGKPRKRAAEGGGA